MADAFWNTHFITRAYEDFFRADRQFELPGHDRHKFICSMDEIIPLSSWWVGEHIARIASSVPVVSHLVMIERDGKFLMGEIRHEAI